MNYVTTNIRFLEEDYLKLKAEAAKKRKSLSAIIRHKIGSKDEKKSRSEVERFMKRVEKHAAENAKYLKGFDIVKALRQMRYEDR